MYRAALPARQRLWAPGPHRGGRKGLPPCCLHKAPLLHIKDFRVLDAPWAGVGTPGSKADVSIAEACLCYCLAQLAPLTQGIFLSDSDLVIDLDCSFSRGWGSQKHKLGAIFLDQNWTKRKGSNFGAGRTG